MTVRLPLFPLGTVLFPGLVLPLHIFEERYRTLVRELREPPSGAPATFGVVAIERGWETAMLAPPSPAAEKANGEGGPASTDRLTLHDVGCSAEIRQITEHTDGRFDLVTVGRRRFRMVDVYPDQAPYLVGEVEWIAEPEVDSAATEPVMPGLLDAFQRYLEVIRTDGRTGGEQLPDDPTVLSYVIAATAVLTVDDRQRLLAAPDTLARLRLERRLLGRELGLLRQVRALPVPLGELATVPSVN
jgi:Lon protease-like protein